MSTPKLKPRDIRYLNKDFTSFRDNLIEFSKTYFPQTYSDFNESSPGMLFIEMSSYIGDVLSYYVDDSLKESMMLHAQDRRNVLSLAQYLGYKPKVTSPAVTTLSVYQLVPAIDSGGGEYVPDEDYYLRVKSGLEIESSDNPDIVFVTTDVIDFSSSVGREISVYNENNNTGAPEFFVVKKEVEAISAEINEEQVSFGSPQPFSEIQLEDTNVIEILDIRDDNGNKYYEVPYLAQDTIYLDYENIERNDDELSQFKDSVPHLLRLLKTPRRFTTKVNEDNTTTITFGVADPTESSELLVPSFKNVGLGSRNSINDLNVSIDPTNFLKTDSYGQAPANTTLTVRYLTGGGIDSNVEAETLTRIVNVDFENDYGGLTQSEIRTLRNSEQSLAVTNEVPATGGRGGESINEIRENALATFGAQKRAVTRKDYVVRSLSMPPKYGSVAKAYAAPDGELDDNSPASILNSSDTLTEFSDIVMDFVDMEETPSESEVKDRIKDLLKKKKRSASSQVNPFAINLYLLSYDNNGNLTELNQAIKQNLKTYLSEYRMLTDGVDIQDGFIINIGVDFEVIVYPNYNKREVVLECINELQDYFDIENWTFNMPINLSEVEVLLAGIEGVSSVPSVKVVNKCSGVYSSNQYDIGAATKNNIIYPSLDPSVFEVKYPNRDIKGRAL